jgi:hypothetical protein
MQELIDEITKADAWPVVIGLCMMPVPFFLLALWEWKDAIRDRRKHRYE